MSDLVSYCEAIIKADIQHVKRDHLFKMEKKRALSMHFKFSAPDTLRGEETCCFGVGTAMRATSAVAWVTANTDEQRSPVSVVAR